MENFWKEKFYRLFKEYFRINNVTIADNISYETLSVMLCKELPEIFGEVQYLNHYIYGDTIINDERMAELYVTLYKTINKKEP